MPKNQSTLIPQTDEKQKKHCRSCGANTHWSAKDVTCPNHDPKYKNKWTKSSDKHEKKAKTYYKKNKPEKETRKSSTSFQCYKCHGYGHTAKVCPTKGQINLN
jgi:hypothetical protein